MQNSLLLSSELISFLEAQTPEHKLLLLDWIIQLSRDANYTPKKEGDISLLNTHLFDTVFLMLKIKRTTKKDYTLSITDIVNHLNQVTGKSFRPNSTNCIKYLNILLNKEYTVEQVKQVIDNKAAAWLNTEHEKYLRPETLFGSKFESYLNEQSTGITKPAAERSAFSQIKNSVQSYISKQHVNPTDN